LKSLVFEDMVNDTQIFVQKERFSVVLSRVSKNACKVADTNGRLLHVTAQMAHLSCVGQKAMDDVIRQKVEKETEKSVTDVSALISKNKMNDDF